MCEKGVLFCVAGNLTRYKERTDELAQGNAMSTETAKPNFKASLDFFEEKVKGRLHAYIKEVQQGRPSVSCLWNETPSKTYKDVVFLGADDDFDALTAVRGVNRSMKASEQVVSMLVEMYATEHGKSAVEGFEY
ncbi:hypothetical protein [Pseudomonas syringae]|uniref:hypothetical protein n=1 Tax=Pseudomonas syringae TaxID=317 RepID=UPI001F1B557B|nr:hypothetical protein [Pseudomonas syringae]MCF5374473.1 hypothetical protein [Pseudomonas syringae]